MARNAAASIFLLLDGVIAGLDPAIHRLRLRWITGSRRWRGGPVMTMSGA
jgi:hypothetical protein